LHSIVIQSQTLWYNNYYERKGIEQVYLKGKYIAKNRNIYEEILRLLEGARGNFISKDELYSIWGDVSGFDEYDLYLLSKRLQAQVSKLRGMGHKIICARDYGYQLVEE